MWRVDKSPNGFKFGTFIGSFSSDGAVNMAVKGLIFIQRYSPLSSRLTALLSYVILHERGPAFYGAFWISTEVVYWQRWLVVRHGWYHVKLLPSWRVLCTPNNHAPCHVTSRKITNVAWDICIFSCNLPPALLAEWSGSFTRYCGNTGVGRIPK